MQFCVSQSALSSHNLFINTWSNYDVGETWSNDTSLLGAYLVKGVAKYLTMVKAYACDRAHFRLANVGAIQSTTETTLEHCHIDLLVPKLQKSEHADYLKECDVKFISLNTLKNLC